MPGSEPAMTRMTIGRLVVCRQFPSSDERPASSAKPAPGLGGQGAGSHAGSRAVFVTDFVHIAVPFEELAPILLDKDAAWLRGLEESTAPNPTGKGEDG